VLKRLPWASLGTPLGAAAARTSTAVGAGGHLLGFAAPRAPPSSPCLALPGIGSQALPLTPGPGLPRWGGPADVPCHQLGICAAGVSRDCQGVVLSALTVERC